MVDGKFFAEDSPNNLQNKRSFFEAVQQTFEKRSGKKLEVVCRIFDDPSFPSIHIEAWGLNGDEIFITVSV